MRTRRRRGPYGRSFGRRAIRIARCVASKTTRTRKTRNPQGRICRRSSLRTSTCAVTMTIRRRRTTIPQGRSFGRNSIRTSKCLAANTLHYFALARCRPTQWALDSRVRIDRPKRSLARLGRASYSFGRRASLAPRYGATPTGNIWKNRRHHRRAARAAKRYCDATTTKRCPPSTRGPETKTFCSDSLSEVLMGQR